MFQEAFEKLDLAEAATILDRVNPLLDGIDFDPVDTVIMAVDISFYSGYRLLDLINYGAAIPSHRYVVNKDNEDIVLNFTNEPIYALNKNVPIVLNQNNVADYVRFFFMYVRGRHGRFLISESVEDINWREEPPPAAKKTIGQMLRPLRLKDNGLDGTYNMTATMMFKDSLFKSDITVTTGGLVTLSNEELLIEDMPVLDDLFGQ